MKVLRSKGNAMRLVNKVKMPSEAMDYTTAIKWHMTKLGRIIRLGWKGDDFERNMFTLQQFVKIPR